MCAYVLMRIFESSPKRYDWGIRIITLGKADNVYDSLASHIESGQRVLDIGCGTGNMTIRAARRGALVKGIDVNPEMLEIAWAKIKKENLSDRVELHEMNVVELDMEESESYDVVTAVLVLSELTTYELDYTLKEVMRILKPGGLFLVADEVVPRNRLKRVINWIIRAPLLLITYLVAQRSSHPIKNLLERLEKAGFIIESIRVSRLENFMEVVARKPKRGTE
ncbi:MAG: corrinoid protein-associated methyltransferase CpaM [Candidatus Baldrarchaeia archaeon]